MIEKNIKAEVLIGTIKCEIPEQQQKEQLLPIRKQLLDAGIHVEEIDAILPLNHTK